MNCPIDTSTLRRSLYRIIAGVTVTVVAGTVITPAAVQACDCGCEIHACDSMSTNGTPCGCQNHARARSKLRFDVRKTPVYKTLDLLAGGIEKALRLDQDSQCGCDDALTSCDDACDDAMLMELSSPLPSLPSPSPEPSRVHSHPAMSPPSAPTPAPTPAPTNRLIQPTPTERFMPRVDAPIMPAEPPISQPRRGSSGLVPAPVESPVPDARPLKTVAPSDAPVSDGLKSPPRPGKESNMNPDDPSPRLPAPIIDRGRNPFRDEPDPAKLDESVDPFLDDPFQSTPLGQQSVGSGLRSVQYQHVQSIATRKSVQTTAHPSPHKTTRRASSRNPKSNRGGMFR